MSFLEQPARYVPDFLICAATEPWQRDEARVLRHQVFVEEQKIFASDDRDAIDAIAIPLVAIADCGPAGRQVVGTVRIHRSAQGIWWGSRLAVAPDFRRVGKLGAELIRLAVGSAKAMGAVEFHAHVQLQNVALFRRLHWHVAEEVSCHDVAHAHMLADLARYTAITAPDVGWRFAPVMRPGAEACHATH